MGIGSNHFSRSHPDVRHKVWLVVFIGDKPADNVLS
jgi:hypothetical protein